MAGFFPNAAIEREFAKQLLKVAKNSGGILNRYIKIQGGNLYVADLESLIVALKNYEFQLDDWAQKICEKILNKIERQNAAAWKSAAVGQSAAGIALSASAARLAGAALLREQVDLIKSLPRHMAERAQSAALAAMAGGRRASELSAILQSAAGVEAARAMLIARTEIAKANATLTRARAEAVGVTHYVWRTVGDAQVRPAHDELDGEIFEFGKAPYVEGEGYHHPGEFPNCRCYAEPIFTEKSATNEK